MTMMALVRWWVMLDMGGAVPDAVVDVRGVSCYYGAHLAVSDVSLQVGVGEVYALLGPNGAGKTTLLEAVHGLRDVGAGTIKVFGEDLSGSPAARGRIGVMFQESALVGDLTPRERLELLDGLSGRTDDPRSVLELVGLGQRGDIRVSMLSGGERRRLDFGVAVFGSPELLFLDEPTAGLDPSSRRALWDAVTVLRDRGSTIVLTTHYLHEADENATRIGILSNGQLVVDKPRVELIESYPSTVTFRTGASLNGVPLDIVDDGEGTWSGLTRDPQGDVFRLLSWAHDTGATLDGLEVRPSTLEQLLDMVTDTGGTAWPAK